MRSAAYDLRRIALLAARSLRQFAPIALQRLLRRRADPADIGVRLRVLFARMGATYVKLGQYLAMRYDLLHPATCAQLAQLMDTVPPEPFVRVRPYLERELGGPLQAFFARFDEQPIAAASIAQVYRAAALDGAELAIKVQRTTAAAEIAADMRNLRRLMRLGVLLHLPEADQLRDILEEFREYTLREIDFLLEARTGDRIGRETPPYARVPQIRWDLTTARVLAMEFIEGTSFSRLGEVIDTGGPEAAEALLPGLPLEDVLERLAQACLHQQFVTGRFHGDPHPGNLLLDPAGRVVFLDFGIFGALDRAQRGALLRHTLFLSAGQFREAFDTLEDLIEYRADTDIMAFRDETIAMLRRWHAASADARGNLSDKVGARYQIEMMTIMRRYGVTMRANQVLFWRAQATLDATIHRLSPGFPLLDAVNRFLVSHEDLQELAGLRPSRDDLRKAVVSTIGALDQASRAAETLLGRRNAGFASQLGAVSVRSAPSAASAAARAVLVAGAVAGLGLLVAAFGLL